MGQKVFYPEAAERILRVHQLSRQFNQIVGKAHQERLLGLVEKHVKEIRELFAKGDSHALVETGDLMILCYELLLEHGVSLDDMNVKCFERYERKLKELIDQEKERDGTDLL